MYKKSKLRLEYPGLFIDKTVDVGTNDVVHIGDTLTYTIEVTNKSQATFTGTGNKYSSFYIKEQLDSKVEYVPGSLNCSDAPCSVSALQDGNILFNVEKELEAGESTTLTYSVKVKDDLNNVGKTISSTGKFYK